MSQIGTTAFRALSWSNAAGRRATLSVRAAFLSEKSDVDHVPFDLFADRRQQRGDIFTLHPVTAAWIEDGL